MDSPMRCKSGLTLMQTVKESTMEIQFKTHEQTRIAELLWNCETEREVNVVLRAFGIDAYIVREMMVAATYDEVEETTLAERVLVDIMSK